MKKVNENKIFIFKSIDTHFLTENAQKYKRNLLFVSSISLLLCFYELITHKPLLINSFLGISFKEPFSFIEVIIPILLLQLYFFINFMMLISECKKAYRNYKSEMSEGSWRDIFTTSMIELNTTKMEYSLVHDNIGKIEKDIWKEYSKEEKFDLLEKNLEENKKELIKVINKFESIKEKIEDCTIKMEECFAESERKIFFIDADFPIIYGLFSIVITIFAVFYI